ncbi:hypothetical protein Scep_015109 [Stephania cephalantha]|uniref:Uncharacterized protein n=1 Tax=Stephania cephalantha TaxID=152367 RepID=A0AAP0P138_9MAGN
MGSDAFDNLRDGDRTVVGVDDVVDAKLQGASEGHGVCEKRRLVTTLLLGLGDSLDLPY